MFEECHHARVFALPPGADFPQALIDGLNARIGSAEPEAWARLHVIVNTRRMERRLQDLLTQGPARLLPKITPVANLADAFPDAGIKPSTPPLQRKLDLARLIGALIEREPDIAPRQSIFALADSLAALLDEMDGEGVSPEALETLDISDISGHWDRSLRFIGIVRAYIDAHQNKVLDPEARQRAVVTNLINRWEIAPPTDPILVAGSTGSRATTALLMDAVASLPKGAVILPGYDFEMPDDAWQTIGDQCEDHPQARFALLMERLALSRDDIRPWAEPKVPRTRNQLISLALRPAPVTDQWLRDGPQLGDLSTATSQMTLVEAPSPRIEAQAIALRLRKAIDDGMKAALVSPDRMLTRQVTAALGRWGIEPDDSAGRPLALTAPGRFLRHIADLMGRKLTARELIVLLKHPLADSGGSDRGPHLLNTRELELYLRRRAVVFPTAQTVEPWIAANEARRDWAHWVFETLGPLTTAQDCPMSELLNLHRLVAENLAGGPKAADSGGLWLKESGDAAHIVITEMAAVAPGPGTMAPADYRSLLGSVMNSQQVRDPVTPHRDVMIWGTLEARVQGAQLVILGGLNEGVWPEMPAADPWLNRALRREAGLLLPERRIGLSAHDFQQAVAAPEVMITRSKRDTEAETVPSRWLNRLTNLVGGLPDQGGAAALDKMRARGQKWVQLAQTLDHPATVTASAKRPSPRPPLKARPRQLSVTEIKTLIRDPFAIYARHVLRLRHLDALEREPDAAMRGNAFHKIMERFLTDGIDPFSDQAPSRFLEIASDVLDSDVPWPATRRLWFAALKAIAGRFLEGEMVRRAAGTPFPPERRGSIEFATPLFKLTGTADRIDQLKSGALAIYDYKSGSVPSDLQVRHFDKQLLLEAMIAEDGGFEDVSTGTVERVGYISLGRSANDRDITLEMTPKADYRVATIAAEFCRLIDAYAQMDQGYTARRAVEDTRFDGYYDHLARYGEWEDSDDPVCETIE